MKLPSALTVLFYIILCALTVGIPQRQGVQAQEPVDVTIETSDVLSISEATLIETVDIYEQPVLAVTGQVLNESDDALENVAFIAEVYDAQDTLIGEGTGYLVDACAAAADFSYIFPAQQSHKFNIILELYEDDADIQRVTIFPQMSVASPDSVNNIELAEGVTRVSYDEVIAVEWQGTRTLRFATGCLRSRFDEWTWQSYNSLTDVTRSVTHPAQAFVTEQLQQSTGLTDPLIFDNAFLRFAPDGERIVYQDAVNRFYTASIMGTLQRLMFTGLHNESLQGVYWLDQEKFIAYYYAAYGDTVIYFTADAEGRFISPSPLQNRESVITPGASSDGRRVILAGTFNDVTGYFIHVVSNGFFELLFEADFPGNNYPAPIPIVDIEQDIVTRIYVARDVDGQPTLQCFNRENGTLYDIAPLPIQLAQGERAWWWISPDYQTIALAANGSHGGLWLIDLSSLPDCGIAIPEVTAETTEEANS